MTWLLLTTYQKKSEENFPCAVTLRVREPPAWGRRPAPALGTTSYLLAVSEFISGRLCLLFHIILYNLAGYFGAGNANFLKNIDQW